MAFIAIDWENITVEEATKIVGLFYDYEFEDLKELQLRATELGIYSKSEKEEMENCEEYIEYVKYEDKIDGITYGVLRREDNKGKFLAMSCEEVLSVLKNLYEQYCEKGSYKYNHLGKTLKYPRATKSTIKNMLPRFSSGALDNVLNEYMEQHNFSLSFTFDEMREIIKKMDKKNPSNRLLKE